MKGILLVCCIYRPPHSSSAFWQKLSWSFEKATDISNNIVILGDLNIDFLKVNNSHEIHTIMNNYRLTNIIHEPTRSTHNTNTLIDPIIISENICVHDSGTLSVCNVLSDQLISIFTRKQIQTLHINAKFGITSMQIWNF